MSHQSKLRSRSKSIRRKTARAPREIRKLDAERAADIIDARDARWRAVGNRLLDQAPDLYEEIASMFAGSSDATPASDATLTEWLALMTAVHSLDVTAYQRLIAEARCLASGKPRAPALRSPDHPLVVVCVQAVERASVSPALDDGLISIVAVDILCPDAEDSIEFSGWSVAAVIAVMRSWLTHAPDDELDAAVKRTGAAWDFIAAMEEAQLLEEQIKLADLVGDTVRGTALRRLAASRDFAGTRAA